MSGLLVHILKGTYKNKSYNSPDLCLCSVILRLDSSDSVAVGLVAIGLCVVECLHLLTGSPLVSGFFFPQQVSAMVVQVTRQQETAQ